MTTAELWLKGLDLASIATYLMAITVAVLLYTSRPHRSQHGSTKR